MLEKWRKSFILSLIIFTTLVSGFAYPTQTLTKSYPQQEAPVKSLDGTKEYPPFTPYQSIERVCEMRKGVPAVMQCYQLGQLSTFA